MLYREPRPAQDRAPMATRNAFVGRQHEIDDVTAAFDDALAGRGSLFLLVGGAGIGKTRLADELGRRASENGFSTYWGRCWEMGGAPVYWPWIQILRELSRDLPRDELRASAGAAADDGGAAGPGARRRRRLHRLRKAIRRRRGFACSTRSRRS